MNITVINGTEKRGVTYRLKEMFLTAFRDNASITEYYLPGDCPNFCNGCVSCTIKGEYTNLITKAKFSVCRLMQQALHKKDPEYLDGKYWAGQGWLGKARPWK